MSHERQFAVGGDFNRIFDHRDFLAMISIHDEATCILRAHLILEEVLNIWTSKVTKTDDLFSGGFVPFRTKLLISRNLGMPAPIFEILDKINEIRNRFSHRKGYTLEGSAIESLRTRVDSIVPEYKIEPCDTFKASVSGKNGAGEREDRVYEWASADNRIKFNILFVILMLNITHWIQTEFISRGIPYTIISTEEKKS